jgi:hypothetical protein
MPQGDGDKRRGSTGRVLVVSVSAALARRERGSADPPVIPAKGSLGDASACASSAPIRDRVRLDSFAEVPDSFAFGSASGMTGESFGSLV